SAAVEAADGVAGGRREPTPARRRCRDAVAARPRRPPRVELAARRIEPTVHSGLAGEPELAVAVERRGVEIGIGELAWERKQLDLARRRVDARDRVLPALGDPRHATRPDDDAMRRRVRAERDLIDR